MVSHFQHPRGLGTIGVPVIAHASEDSVKSKEEVKDLLQEWHNRMERAGDRNQWRMMAYLKAIRALDGINEFEKVTRFGLKKVAGIGDALSEKIISLRDRGTHFELEELRAKAELAPEFPRAMVQEILRAVTQFIREKFPDIRIEGCGSYRRGASRMKDLDVLVTSAPDLAEHLASLGESHEGRAEVKVFLRLEGFENKFPIDFRIVPEQSWEPALLWFTGSKVFNIKCREIAKSKGLTLNRLGLFQRDTGDLVSLKETEILEILGLPWIPAEKR